MPPEGISELDSDLAGIADTAAETIFDVQGSVGEQEDPEEQPEEVEESEADALDDEDPDELDDLEDEDEDDQELEDGEDSDEDDDLEDDEDESDEEDLEDEDEDDSEEDDEESDDDDDQEDQLYTVKVQGEEFQVPVEELVAGYQRQQDYTLKTQQVSEIYNKMSEWYEQRANDPEFWVQEIVSGQDDPSETIAGAISKTGQATTILGQTLKHLVESGSIADELVEALNLTQVAEQAKEQGVELKVQRLEQQLQERDQQAQQQAEHQQVEQEINRQWAGLGLQFDDPSQEHNAKVELLTFARDRGIPNLQDAYVLMTSQQGDKAAPTKQKTAQKKKAKSAVKKRKTAAMSRKPTGGQSPKRRKSPSADPVKDAAAAALADLGLDE